MKNILLLPLLLLLSACVSHIKPTPPMTKNTNTKNLHRLYAFYEQWKEVPYHYGGCSKKGVDCSCFVAIAIQKVYGQSLPRTTTQMLETLKEVPSNKLTTGDLVFFHSYMSGYHVGIYLEKDKFLEASTQGVRISSLFDAYWSERYIGAREI